MSCFAPGEAAPLTFDGTFNSQKESVPLGLYRTQVQISLCLCLDKQFAMTSEW